MAITRDLGIVTAYGYAKSKGYTGTEEEFATLMADYADVADIAEAWAVGTRAGVPVEEGDEAYHNNSKYYAEQAADSASAASDSAGLASGSAGAAKDSEDAAAASEAAAKDYADHIADPVSGLVTGWLNDHVDPDTGYVIDNTLTVQNAAADAKKVGDELTDVKSALGSADQNYVFEIGAIASATGEDMANNTRIRCKPFYAVRGQVFSVSTEENILALYQYDYSGNYVGMVTDGSYLSTATAPVNGIYRVAMKKDAAGSVISDDDIPTIVAKLSPSAVAYPLPYINRDELNAFEAETNGILNGLADSVKTHTVTHDKSDLNPSPGYINSSGGISGTSGSSGYYYSATVLHCVKGDVITLNSSTTSFAGTVVIAEKISSTRYQPLVTGASGVSSYTYTVQHDGDYAFTFGGGVDYIVTVSLPVIIRQISDIDDSFLRLNDHDYLPLFNKVACLGDSLTRGFNTTYPSGARNRDFGYPWVLARKTQLKVWNYGHSGATPSYLWTDLQNTDFSAFDLAIICLGRNGGINSDADKTAYQNLIDKLLTDNEHMTIFICSLPANGIVISSTDAAINARIQTIASANDLPYIDIWGDYGGAEYRTGDEHYNPMGYVKMCDAIIKGINSYIAENLSDFLNLWMPSTLPQYIDGQVE